MRRSRRKRRSSKFEVVGLGGEGKGKGREINQQNTTKVYYLVTKLIAGEKCRQRLIQQMRCDEMKCPGSGRFSLERGW